MLSKKLKVTIIVVLCLLIFHIFLSLFGWSLAYPINEFFNSLKPIDKSCVIDEDCKMAKVDCSCCMSGSKGGAVNKKYKPFCPIPLLTLRGCLTMMPRWASLEAVCENNKCIEKKQV